MILITLTKPEIIDLIRKLIGSLCIILIIIQIWRNFRVLDTDRNVTMESIVTLAVVGMGWLAVWILKQGR